MKKEILKQLSWEDIREIYIVADEVYYVATIKDSDAMIFTEALNRLKEKAE